MSVSIQGISVVIPAFNEEKFLPDTLKSVQIAGAYLKLKSGISSEVVVIDNASTDGTCEIAKEFGAHVYRHEVRNISSVRNEGIRKARFPIIVTIDADCFMPQESLYQIWEFMLDERYIGASLGVKIVSKNRRNAVIAKAIQAIVSCISKIQGAIFVFRRDASLEVGGFSEKHLVAEDSIFAIAMANYARTEGKTFTTLFSVKISTLDRKEINIFSLPGLAWKVLCAFLGKKQKIDELDFWYKPKR